MLPLNSRKLIIFNWNSERISVSLKGILAKRSNVPVGQVLSGPELELNYWYKLLKCRCKLIWIPSINQINQNKQDIMSLSLQYRFVYTDRLFRS